MHIIGLIGYQGVGKSEYARNMIRNMSIGSKVKRMSFADTPRQSVSEQFGLDIDIFYTDKKDERRVARDFVTTKQEKILFREGEDKISYRDLMIRWTDWEKDQGDKTIYLQKSKLEIDEHKRNGVDFIIFDDLRLFMEHSLLCSYSHEVRVLIRKDHQPRPYAEMNSFEKEMTRLLEHNGGKFRWIDITR